MTVGIPSSCRLVVLRLPSSCRPVVLRLPSSCRLVVSSSSVSSSCHPPLLSRKAFQAPLRPVAVEAESGFGGAREVFVLRELRIGLGHRLLTPVPGEVHVVVGMGQSGAEAPFVASLPENEFLLAVLEFLAKRVADFVQHRLEFAPGLVDVEPQQTEVHSMFLDEASLLGVAPKPQELARKEHPFARFLGGNAKCLVEPAVPRLVETRINSHEPRFQFLYAERRLLESIGQALRAFDLPFGRFDARQKRNPVAKSRQFPERHLERDPHREERNWPVARTLPVPVVEADLSCIVAIPVGEQLRELAPDRELVETANPDPLPAVEARVARLPREIGGTVDLVQPPPKRLFPEFPLPGPAASPPIRFANQIGIRLPRPFAEILRVNLGIHFRKPLFRVNERLADAVPVDGRSLDLRLLLRHRFECSAVVAP